MAGRRASARTNDPERTRADIIEVATREFAEKGLAGARIDDIAAAMRTSKPTICTDSNSAATCMACCGQGNHRMRRDREMAKNAISE